MIQYIFIILIILFYFFIFSTHPIYLCIIMFFIILLNVILLIYLNLTFLALLMFSIYIGAILILFAISFMFLNLKIFDVFEVSKYNLKFIFVNFLFHGFMLSYLFIIDDFFFISENTLIIWIEVYYIKSIPEILGIFLYQVYSYYTCIISMLLLLAIIGPIFVLRNKFYFFINLNKSQIIKNIE